MSRTNRIPKRKSSDNRRETLMQQVRKKERKQQARPEPAPLDKLFKLAAMHTAATSRILLKLHKYAREAALEEAQEVGSRSKHAKRSKRKYADDEAEEDSAYDDEDSADQDMEDDYDSLDAPSAYSLHTGDSYDDDNDDDDYDAASRDYDNEHPEDYDDNDDYASGARSKKRKRRAALYDSEDSDQEDSDDNSKRRDKKRAKQAGGHRALASNAPTFGFGPEHGAALTFDAAETISFGQGTGVRPSTSSVQIDARSGREIVASQVADPFGLFAQHQQQQPATAAPQYSIQGAAPRASEVNLFATAPVPMSASQLMRNEPPQQVSTQSMQQSQGARTISVGLPPGFMQPPTQAPVANVSAATAPHTSTAPQVTPTIAVVTDAAPTTAAVSTHTPSSNASATNANKATFGSVPTKPRKVSSSGTTSTATSAKRAEKKSGHGNSSSTASAELPMISVRLDDATL